MPDEVVDLASVIAAGSRDDVNQINKVLAFLGILRGALDARTSEINDAMKQTAGAIAGVPGEGELSSIFVVLSVFSSMPSSALPRSFSALRTTRVVHRAPKSASFYDV